MKDYYAYKLEVKFVSGIRTESFHSSISEAKEKAWSIVKVFPNHYDAFISKKVTDRTYRTILQKRSWKGDCNTKKWERIY